MAMPNDKITHLVLSTNRGWRRRGAERDHQVLRDGPIPDF